MNTDDIARQLVAERTLRHDGWSTAIASGAIAALLAVVGVGAYLAQQAGRVYAPGVGTAVGSRIGGLLQTTPAWLTPVGLIGLSGLMVAVAVTLIRVRRTVELRRDATLVAFPVLVAEAAHDHGRTPRHAREHGTPALFRPGQSAPVTGTYLCDLDHQRVELHRGRTIPPCPGGSHHRFRLIEG